MSNIVSVTNAESITTNYVYDVRNRVFTEINKFESNLNITDDDANNQISITGDLTITFTYEALNHLRQEN